MDVRVEALKRREAEAWRAVYEQCVDSVFTFAWYRLQGDRAAAEDLTQEVFARAIASIGTFRGGPEDLPRWLRGIGRRVAARQARQLAPIAARPLSLDCPSAEDPDRPALDAVDPGEGADVRLSREETRERTGAALALLPEQWERVLRWKYAERLRVDEIAGRLGLSLKAVESMLSRARAGFRRAYAQLNAADNDEESE